MISYDQLEGNQSRHRQQLLGLCLLARSQEGIPQDFSAEVREATNAVIAEAEAMSRTSIRSHDRREPQAETFLWVRIARLATAADRAVDAARRRDMHGVVAHLQQFDALTSALWAVRQATILSL